MGWDWGYEPIEELKRRICEGDGFKKPVAFSKRSNRVWTCHQLPDGNHIFTVWLLGSRAKEGMSGYNYFDEDMGPYAMDVPIKWLDKYPTNSAPGNEWRQKARLAHLAKARLRQIKIEPGLLFTMNGKNYEVDRPYHNGRWVIRVVGTHTIFQCSAACIRRCVSKGAANVQAG